MVKGDPAAVRALAAAYSDLADDLSSHIRTALRVLHGLSSTWSGVGQRAANQPFELLSRDCRTVVRGLQGTADRLDSYATALAKAEEHHGWSIGKLVAIGAVVVVTGGTLAITISAAAAASAGVGAIAGETAAATAAAASADAAAASAAVDLTDAASLLSSLRPFAAFVLPHVEQGVWGAGTTALLDEIKQGSIDWHSVLAAGAANTLGSAAAEPIVENARPLLSQLPDAIETAAPHLLKGLVWGGANGLEDLDSAGKINPIDVGEGLLFGAAGSAASEARAAWSARRALAKALKPSKLTRGLLAGVVDLEGHEAAGGHVLGAHVRGTVHSAIKRLARNPTLRAVSLFADEPTAAASITALVRDHLAQIHSWAAAGGRSLVLRGHYRDGFVGKVVTPDGTITHTTGLEVVLERRGPNIVIKTAFPVLDRMPEVTTSGG